MSRPERHGKPWSTIELEQLLGEIQKKKTLEEIATEHQRTNGGIRSKLRDIAADYYYNDNRPIQEIMKLTGLDIETVTDAISKRQYQMDMKEKKQKEQPAQQTITQAFQTQPKQQEPEEKRERMIPILKDIRDMMKEMLDIMKKNDALSKLQ